MRCRLTRRIGLPGGAWCAFLVGVLGLGAVMGDADAASAPSIVFAIQQTKDVYYMDEPVELTYALENSGAEAVYVDLTEPRVEVIDASGATIHAPTPDPNTPVPAHYYVDRGGQRVLTVPVRRIARSGVSRGTIPDALKGYREHLSTGRYSLRATVTLGLYRAELLIPRSDYPDQLWAKATGGLPQLKLESNLIDIQVRARPAPLAKAEGNSDATFPTTTTDTTTPTRPPTVGPTYKGLLSVLGGVLIIGVGGLCLVVLLKRRSSERG